MDSAKRYLRTRAAAEYLGVAASTLENYRSEGGGPRYCRPSGRRFIVYDRADLDAWIRAGRRSSTSDSTPRDDAAAWAERKIDEETRAAR